jgi:uncharacterized protein (DUF1501 family)
MEHGAAGVAGMDAAVRSERPLRRRTLLGLALAGGASAAGLLPPIRAGAYAAPTADGAKLLLVFLRGGYDAANVVIPVGSPFYYEARPTLAVPRPDPANASAALPLAQPRDAVTWGLHPVLKDSIYPLWQQRHLAFVAFAGSEDMTRSHFETQDSIESGLPLAPAGQKVYGSGFLNRLAAVLGGAAQPVSFTEGLPTVMVGDVVVPNVSLRGRARGAIDDRHMKLLASMYVGTRFEPLIDEGLELRRMVRRQAEAQAGGMNDEMRAASRNAISARGFDVVARRVAGLMREKFNLAFLDVGGWDTHVDQGAARGQLAQRLDGLGQGLAAFAQHMGTDWTNTVVIVLSEFGRTFRENGTRGTDHGYGTVYWVLGGAVKGGRIVGDQVAINRRTLNQDRDWPVLTDYRALLGGLFQRMYGFSNARLQTVFPGAAALDLGLL